MTMHLTGWVEVSPPPWRSFGWAAAVNVLAIVPSTDRSLHQFFMETADQPLAPVAAGRGLPNALSELVRREVESQMDSREEPFAETWCTWDELEPFARADLVDADVSLLFALVRTLAEQYGGTHVRLVGWFSVFM